MLRDGRERYRFWDLCFCDFMAIPLCWEEYLFIIVRKKVANICSRGLPFANGKSDAIGRLWNSHGAMD